MTQNTPPGTEENFASLTTEENRWKNVEKQFLAVNLRLSTQDVEIASVKTEVGSNTKLMQQIADDTQAIRVAWNDGVAAKRLFCRLADAYRFVRKELLVPIVLPLLALYAIGYYATHGTMPQWIEAMFKLIGL